MSKLKKFEKFGKYTLVKKIAMGGMAEIFIATNGASEGISKFVVLKRILPQFSANKNFIEMFKNEGKITANLKHANMVSIHEFGMDQDLFYITMDYISGCSLKDLMNRVKKKKVKLSIPSIVNIIRSIASALHYAHTYIDPSTGLPLNIIHRDVSPHNILLGFNGDIKLIDFGIAKGADSSLTSAGVMKGKFSYMSPEQVELQSEKLDHRTDIYSLGVVLWELLAGRKLFQGATVNEIIESIKKSDIPDIRTLRSNIPVGLVKILNLTLAKNREKRYQSAEKLERHLGAFLNHEYTSFSNFDFQLFMKNLYENQILKERKFFVESSKILSEPQALEENQVPEENQVTEQESDPSVVKQAPKIAFADRDVSNNKTSEFKAEIRSKTQSKSMRAPVRYTDQPRLGDTMVQKAPLLTVDEDDKVELQEQKQSEQLGNETSYISLYEEANSRKRSYERSKTAASAFILMALIGGGYFLLAFFDITPGLQSILAPSVLQEEYSAPPGENDHPLYKKSIDNNLIGQQGRSRQLDRKVASQTFSVFIETIPSGSDIYLNDEKVSKNTPAEIEIPVSGDHTLTLKKRGYESVEIKNLRPNQEIKIKLNRNSL